MWILGPRFSFFAGTSTHTCMPLLSYLFTQLSVDKHCLLKSTKTASSGKIVDIFNFLLKNKLVSLGKAGARSTLRVGLRTLLVSTFVYLHIYKRAGPLSGRAGFLPFLQHPPADSLDVTALPEYRCVSYRWAQEASRTRVERGDRGISSYETAKQEILDEILESENVKVIEHAAGLLSIFFTCATASDQQFPVTS